MQKKPGSEFRSWLVNKVSTSVFAFYKDDTDEELARRIGVQVDVLHDARLAFEERKIREQLPEGQRMGYRDRARLTQTRKQHGNYDKIFLDLPDEIYEEWVALREQRRVKQDSILLRSVMHVILQTKTQPSWLGQSKVDAWLSKDGRWIGKKNIRNRRGRVAGRLGHAAFEALRQRARNTGVKPGAIARWAVNLFVHHKLGPSLLILPTVASMYKSPDEYCINPIITER